MFCGCFSFLGPRRRRTHQPPETPPAAAPDRPAADGGAPSGLHRSASFCAPPKAPYVYDRDAERSYQGGNEHVLEALSKEPFATGKTARIYVARRGDKVFKRVTSPAKYTRERELVKTLCTGQCRYVMGRCDFIDALCVVVMPNYTMDVHAYVHENGLLSEPEALRLCADVCLGLLYIHSKGYVYGDLKMENVCVKNRDIARPVLVDIGSCHENNPAITLETASPEALRGEPLTAAHDTWTLGVFFMELTTTCVVNPSRVRDEHPEWYRGDAGSVVFLGRHPLFAGCTRFDRQKRACNFVEQNMV